MRRLLIDGCSRNDLKVLHRGHHFGGELERKPSLQQWSASSLDHMCAGIAEGPAVIVDTLSAAPSSRAASAARTIPEAVCWPS